MKKWLLLFILTSTTAYAAVGAQDRVVSKIVGELGTTKYFLTSREVQINNFLGQLLSQMYGSKKTSKVIGIQDKDFPNQTSEVLLEWAIYKDAFLLGYFAGI